MALRSKHFFNREELTKFVNDNKISKENIQSINVIEDKHFVLFYWESTTING
jgi:hypothetical protein